MNYLRANSVREVYRCLPPQVDTHEERPPCPYCGLDCCSCNPYGNDNELLVQPNLDPDSTTFAKGKARMAVQPNRHRSSDICPYCGSERGLCNHNMRRAACPTDLKSLINNVREGDARMAPQLNMLGSEPICPNCGCEFCRCNPYTRGLLVEPSLRS